MKKILIALVSLVVLLGLGGYYYASTLLSPESLRKMAIEKGQVFLPGAVLDIGKIELGWGLKFKLNVDRLAITPKDGGNPLFLANNFHVDIPILAVIFRKGEIDVKMDQPEMYYKKVGESNNWLIALGKSATKATKAEAEKGANETGDSNSMAKESSALAGKIAVNLVVDNVKIRYEMGEQKGELAISSFLIKKLNLTSPSAYEVNSSMKVKMGANEFSGNCLIIGEFNLPEYLKNKTLSVDSTVHFKNGKYTMFNGELPELKGELKMNVLSDYSVEGDFHGDWGSKSKLSFKFDYRNGETKIKNTDVKLSIAEIMESLQYSVEGIEWRDAVFNLQGEVKKTPTDQKINVQFSLNPKIGFSFSGQTGDVSAEGKLNDKDFSGNAEIGVGQGKIKARAVTTVDLNAKSFAVETLPETKINVELSNFEIPKEKIRAVLYETKPQTAASAGSAADKSNEKVAAPAFEAPKLPRTRVDLSWKEISIAGEKFSGKGLIQTQTHSIEVKNMDFSFSKGRGSLVNSVVFTGTETKGEMKLTMMGLNMNSFGPFLPAMLKGIEGTFQGAVSGTYSMKKSGEIAYNMSSKMNAKNGEIKGLDISSYMSGIIQKVPALKGKVENKVQNLGGKFDSFDFNGAFTEKNWVFKEMRFVGQSNNVIMSGAGHISPLMGPGEILLDFQDNMNLISPQVQKISGKKTLPLKLVGMGFGLMPDYEYTIAALAKGFLGKQKEVIKEKVKEKATEEVKKVIEQGLEKYKDKLPGDLGKPEGVKKLFKGLFGK